ncbi:hypothetical protein FRC06_010304, partial [Ceratobasidium sp. 370]
MGAIVGDVAPKGGRAAEEGVAASLVIAASGTFLVRFGAAATESFVYLKMLNRPMLEL